MSDGKRTGKIMGKQRLGGLLNVDFRAENKPKSNSHNAESAA
jgi:hypothetical protein